MAPFRGCRITLGVLVWSAAALFNSACSGNEYRPPETATTADSSAREETATTADSSAREETATTADSSAREETAKPASPQIPDLEEDIEALMSPCTPWDVRAPCTYGFDPERIDRVGAAGDIRLAWVLADILRFSGDPEAVTALKQAIWRLTGVPTGSIHRWSRLTDYLIAEDVPPPDDYQRHKGSLYRRFGPGWVPFFDDPDADVDWRYIAWGGVGIDDRPIGAPDAPCTCIPALNDPTLTAAASGSWYPDDRLVFGIELNGEARAYPKHQMQVHEMVNDTLGGRRIGVVYCTLCGTAQAFLTDSLPDGIETPTGTFELRTSGLLSRSNKVMFELHTFSYFDTFRGRAISGPLQDVELELEQVTVAVASWGDWREGHPDTTIVARDGGLGREYLLDPLGDRDDGGPIFPIGEVDPRLPVQDQVLGVRHQGITVAFPEIRARATLAAGLPVHHAGINVGLASGALVATAADGTPITTHQSFWFAWSQFFPETELWGGG